MMLINRDYSYMMPLPEVVRITQHLNLLQALLEPDIEKQIQCEKATFERLWIYCMMWSMGGLLETEDREKFHKYLESRNAPLPPITA